MFEESKDPYQAQLAKSRSSKIASAEKLVERAQKDSKVQKVINKRANQGRGRGRGRGRNGVSANGGTTMDTDPTPASADLAASRGDDGEPPKPSKPEKSTCSKTDSTTSPTADDEPTPTKDLETAWAEKETYIYIYTIYFC